MKATLLGQIVSGSLILHQLFVIALLLTRRESRKDHSLAMVVFFAANVLASLPDVLAFFRAGEMSAMSTASSAFLLLLGPSVYFYCRALVSPEVLRLGWRDARHLLPFGVALLAGAVVLALAGHLPQAQAATPVLTPSLVALAGAHVAMFVVFIGATSYYLVQVVRLLMRYRRSMFDYFSAIEGRSLTWFEWMIGLLTLVWLVNLGLYAVSLSGQEHAVSPDVAEIIEAAWVYALSFMVLWQQAIFKPYRHWHGSPKPEPEEEPDAPAPENATPETSAKYQRSALDEERMRRISAKVERAMAQDQLYRNQNITLRHLSDHTGVSENYLSQVLNHALGRSFYEFINHWRIKDACALLAEEAHSIIEIGEEVGFNSRSTFNAAFKKETGLTPSEYRATLRCVV